MKDETISLIKKNKFKEIVKKNAYEKAFDELIAKKESHSKMNDLNYEKLKIQLI